MRSPKKIKLTTKNQLAMYRCAFYTAMGVVNAEALPSDQQCLKWLQAVCVQAQHRTDPPIVLVARPPQVIHAAAPLSGDVAVLRFDAMVSLPEWRER